ncbi:MAG TPA: N-acetylmuramoyl-L-alanine amidase-like domain-containing protein [Dysgonamonadaceae bacterium]|nr:N-acetylmuramoyl-L-alanine amidase-like domain-containing protein [Dysgonamonadaceae bacterium]
MKLNYYFLLTAILILLSENIFSQEITVADKDEALFNKYIEQITPYKTEPLETVLEKTAQFFLETPYVAHTLDKGEKEKLVINLHELDCFTYVENVMALSFAARSNNLSMKNFMDQLVEIRYRNNEITDYASRLHYTSDWLFENERNGLLENISKDLSGVKEAKKIDFMSTHRNAYKQLADDDVMLEKIVEIENKINDRGGFHYLPKDLIAAKANDIPHMAMIGFVTAIDGLDISHVGFAYRKDDGELTFIHASSAEMKVVVDAKSLSDYCFSQKNCKGIVVVKVSDKH